MPPIVAAMLVVLLEALAFGTALPTLNLFVAKLGGGTLWAGVLFALVSGPKVIFNPLFGRAADRLGRRPLLLICTLGTMTSSIGWALAPGIWWLAAARLLNGIFGAQAGLAQAVAADVSAPEKRAGAVGLLGAAFGIAFAFGPLIGGRVAEHYGFAAVGWVCAAMQGTSLLIIALALRETLPAPRAARVAAHTPAVEAAEIEAGHATMIESVRSPLLTRAEIAILLIVTLFVTVGQSEISSTLADVAKRLYGFGTRQTGDLFALFGVVMVVVQGGVVRHVVKYFGELFVSLSGLAILAIGFVWIATEPSLLGMRIALVLVGLGSALSSPALTALLSHAVRPDQQGEVMGLNQATLGIGRAAGNLSGGFLFERHGTPLTYLVAAGTAAASLVIQASQHARLARIRPIAAQPSQP